MKFDHTSSNPYFDYGLDDKWLYILNQSGNGCWNLRTGLLWFLRNLAKLVLAKARNHWVVPRFHGGMLCEELCSEAIQNNWYFESWGYIIESVFYETT